MEIVKCWESFWLGAIAASSAVAFLYFGFLLLCDFGDWLGRK